MWNPDNIRDVAESVGIAALSDEVLHALSSDVEYRLSQVLEEALKFMTHSRSTTLSTNDIAQALRVLDVEPLYGYESTRPLRFGEASLGPGQPLFYVEDEEVDFEKLINAPLPKIPREVAFTGKSGSLRQRGLANPFKAHWLAVEGVQPSIPQNPTTSDARNQELMPKGAGANPNIAAISGNDNVTVKPLVKHILSKELQLYFEKICAALLDETNDEYRLAALSSLRTDPGLHQLVPYFVQFIAEKVTHTIQNLFVLKQMLDLTSAMLENESLFIDPYIASLVPPVLTCLVSPRLGSSSNPLEHFPVRSFAASILGHIARKYAKSSHTLKPRLARTCLKHFLDPKKPFEVHFGAIRGLTAVSGREGVRALIIPNLKEYGKLLQDGIEAGPPGSQAAEYTVAAIIDALKTLGDGNGPLVNGYASGDVDVKRSKLEGKLGPTITDRVLQEGNPRLVQAVMES